MEWINVKNALPEYGEKVLLFSDTLYGISGNIVGGFREETNQHGEIWRSRKRIYNIQYWSKFPDTSCLGWIPIKNRLPDYGKKVLILNNRNGYVGRRDYTSKKGEHWRTDDEFNVLLDNVTHWMPIKIPEEIEKLNEAAKRIYEEKDQKKNRTHKKLKPSIWDVIKKGLTGR